MAKKKTALRRKATGSSSTKENGPGKKKARKKSALKKKPGPRKPATKKSARSDSSSVDGIKEKLQTLLEAADSQDRIIQLLAPLNEKQRKAVAPFCVAWLKKQKRTEFIEGPPGTFRWNPFLRPAEVAVFCVSGLTDIKRVGRRSLPAGDLLVEILKRRKPKWADQIAEMLLDGSFYWGSWRTVRAMVNLKLCPKPSNPRYYTGMITGLCGGRFDEDRKDALTALRADPALLKDEVWRLFEYEGDGENTLANVDRWEATSWSGALATLSQEGRLSRPRLLAAALGALQLGFNHYRAKWFFTFFDLLEPNDRELRKHADTIIDLVGNRTPNVAAWAFAKVEQMQDRGLINDASQLAEAVRPLLMARPKKTVQKTLKLLDRLAQTSPQSADEISLTAADAVGHEKVEIQKAAFRLISKYGSADSEELRDEVRRYLPVVAASFRGQLTEWLELPAASADAEKPVATTSEKATGSTTRFDRRRLKSYPASHVALMKIDELVTALECGGDDADVTIPAATFQGTEIPRLNPEARISPINDLDELIEVCGRVLEDPTLIDDGERVIDGLSRLSSCTTEDFGQLIGPLVKRARSLITKRHKIPFAGESISCDLCGLICAWVNPQPITFADPVNNDGNHRREIHGVLDEPLTAWAPQPHPLSFLSHRSLDLARRLSDEPAPLLSAPTHKGGWIDSAEWVRRINSLAVAPGDADLVLSMLRLAPDGKATAMKALKPKIKGEWVNVARYALGGKVARTGDSGPLWIAAARARTPLGEDSKVSRAFSQLGENCGDAPQFRVRYYERQWGGKIQNDAAVEPVVKPAVKPDVMFPTLLMQLNRMDDSLSFWDIGIGAGSINWVETMWPLERDSFFAAGAQCLVENIDWWEAAWHNRCFLNPLLDPDTPPREIGLFMLFCGLASKEPGEHGLAVDIAIQAITDGRLGTDNLCTTIARNGSSGVFNLKRLAARFQEIATASALHAFVVMHAWEHALNPDFNKVPRGLGDILELMCELGAQLNRGVQCRSCREFLESFSGSNKTAKAAKQLLSLNSSCSATEWLHQALESRIDRLNNWAST